jgi:alpha-L-rhamnosidase
MPACLRLGMHFHGGPWERDRTFLAGMRRGTRNDGRATGFDYCRTSLLSVFACFLLLASGGMAAGLEAPTALRCEYATNPMNVETPTPRMSWQIKDDRRGAVQSAYQIMVRADAGNVVWDSGKVVTDQSVYVPYGGPPLISNQRYHWKVRTWNEEGAVSAYSAPAFWQMALLSSQDWRAQWIAMANQEPPREKVALGKWIWHPAASGENHTIYLRRVFSIPKEKTLKSARLFITADNGFVVYVNGQEIGRDSDWKSLERYDVGQALRAGDNVVAVQANNTLGDFGFVCGIRLTFADGSEAQVLSDEQWKTNAEEQADWQSAGYNDRGWLPPLVFTDYGQEPWGEIISLPPADSVSLRKEFVTEKRVTRATAHVTGLGLYTLYLNGQRVGEDVLTPGWTHYKKRVQYQSYNVTNLLAENTRHAVGAMLGNGWWGGNMASNWRDGPPRFLLQLEIDYVDGTRKQVITDKTWKAHPSPVLEDSHYHGVTHDARLETPGWDRPDFDDLAWRATEVVDAARDTLVAQACPPMRVTEELTALSIDEPKPGMYIFDFGQNMAGRCRLKVRGAAGTRVQIRFSEILQDDGTLFTENYRSARVTDTYILHGKGEEIWEPEFTYRGFRYAELTGYPDEPNKDTLVARVLHSAMPMTGSFTCSNETVNQIQRNIQWGQRSNLHSVPTDCPQRDERMGWTGDVQGFAPTSCWNMDMGAFYGKWMADIRDSQNPDGGVKNICPQYGGGAGAPGWGDIVTVVPWTTYLFYGDARMLSENYAAMKGWVEYMRRHADKGVLYEREGFGDWVAPVESPKKPIGAAYYYYSTKLLARAAAALGETDDAKEYESLANRIAAAFNHAYLADDGNYPGGTQTANVLPLWFGVTPESRRAQVLDNLVADIEARDYHLSTGFLGTAYLLPALTRHGRHDVASRLALQRSYPSWGYTVDNGATTIWELWNGNRIEEAGVSMNSFNHACLGSVGQWFFESVGGIQPDPERPGFKHILIRPHLSDAFSWATMDFQSVYGPIRCAWRKEAGTLKLEVSIPANTSATLYAPARTPDTVREGKGSAAESVGVQFSGRHLGRARFALGAGSYAFSFQDPVRGTQERRTSN